MTESSAPHSDEWWADHWQEKPCVCTDAPIAVTGYGRRDAYRHGRKISYTHVLSWIDYHGCLPPVDKPWILHRCIDSPWCMEPAHLYAGTPWDNAQDRIAQGHHPHGERHTAAKLTRDQVIEIRDRYFAGGVYQRELAAEYGISRQHVSALTRGVFWKHDFPEFA